MSGLYYISGLIRGVRSQVQLGTGTQPSAPGLSYNPSNSTLNWSGGSGGNPVYFYVGTAPGAEVLSFQVTPAQEAAKSLPFAPLTNRQWIQAAYTNNATFDQRSGEVVYSPAAFGPAPVGGPTLPDWAAIILAVALSLVATMYSRRATSYRSFSAKH
jgi:hypothetical protein